MAPRFRPGVLGAVSGVGGQGNLGKPRGLYRLGRFGPQGVFDKEVPGRLGDIRVWLVEPAHWHAHDVFNRAGKEVWKRSAGENRAEPSRSHGRAKSGRQPVRACKAPGRKGPAQGSQIVPPHGGT